MVEWSSKTAYRPHLLNHLTTQLLNYLTTQLPKGEQVKIKSRNHVYETLPPFMNNRQLPPEEQIVVGLKVVMLPEQDAFQREAMAIRSEYALDKAQELIEEASRNIVREKFVSIEGLQIEGFETLDFDTFYKEAPPELVGWVVRAVMSTTELSAAERKNFVPG